MKTLLSILLVFGTLSFSQAQDIQFVNADNGLVVRENPSRGAKRLGMLEYGTPLEITEHTNLQLDVIDNGKKRSGQWVKVRSVDAYDTFEEGYVFNGFLTNDVLEKRFKANYENFTVTIDGLSERQALKDPINPDFDTVLFYQLASDESLFGKTIKVKHHKEFQKIEVFQKHENSIAISDDKSHRDLIEWRHYYSSWKPLKSLTSNRRFQTLNISKEEAERFIKVDIDELKTAVKDACGDSWADAIKDIKTIKDHPTHVALSKLFFRIVMTDLEGEKTEKIIIFEVPIDAEINNNSYAKL